ncbi:hypothetical protein GCK72_023107 [Caenorhabditis remanei]|uniref:Uncharacterized protein n=1 Tax=Caenorhabditis remanei TaxID=31234 RepID=A0A6A5FVI9_CAERE|nr:hypothetical protein GCK72_023107 [Caenorhabditis remanei]KAF1746650.1 hypothetical protein GCK72_023107 [Caenorhabditis remanei]
MSNTSSALCDQDQQTSQQSNSQVAPEQPTEPSDSINQVEQLPDRSNSTLSRAENAERLRELDANIQFLQRRLIRNRENLEVTRVLEQELHRVSNLFEQITEEHRQQVEHDPVNEEVLEFPLPNDVEEDESERHDLRSEHGYQSNYERFGEMVPSEFSVRNRAMRAARAAFRQLTLKMDSVGQSPISSVDSSLSDLSKPEESEFRSNCTQTEAGRNARLFFDLDGRDYFEAYERHVQQMSVERHGNTIVYRHSDGTQSIRHIPPPDSD